MIIAIALGWGSHAAAAPAGATRAPEESEPQASAPGQPGAQPASAAVEPASPAGVRAAASGKMRVELLSAAEVVKAGEPIMLGLKLTIEPGWHTYWSNPGESGMKPSIVWNLPKGFTEVDVQFPFPHEFQSQGMLSYGYEGEVILPVRVNWPATLAEVPTELTIGVKLDWLTCNPDACLPGDAQLSVILPVGEPKSSPAAGTLAAANTQIPEQRDGWSLAVSQQDKSLRLTLQAPPEVDLAKSKALPATELALDFHTPLQFTPVAGQPGTWSATTTRNEFADAPLEQLELVVAPPAGRPVRLTWQK